jgi:hypothetical protein
MVSKLQLRMADVTSVLQYSPALAADGAIAPNATANNAAAGAAVIFKSCFILFSLFLVTFRTSRWDAVACRAIDTEKSKGILCRALQGMEMHRVTRILKYGHHSLREHCKGRAIEIIRRGSTIAPLINFA